MTRDYQCCPGPACRWTGGYIGQPDDYPAGAAAETARRAGSGHYAQAGL